jgi:hypothetical protein
MYWQVYLHKTVLSAENLLVKILQRAKELAEQNIELFSTPSLNYFLYNKINKQTFIENNDTLDVFAQLDDYDVMTSVKVWQSHTDKILSLLCKNMVNRKLYKIKLQKKPFQKNEYQQEKQAILKQLNLNEALLHYFIFTGKIINNAYNPKHDKINILFKDGTILDIAEAADNLNISALSKPVTKHFLCYLKS